jgi:hypothetical protein
VVLAVVLIGVLLVAVIAGWLLWRSSRADAMSTPAGRRATDEEISSTIESDAVPAGESGSGDDERAET